MVKTTDLVADLRVCLRGECSVCGHECGNAACLDRIMEDAADKIEELVDRCARYAEEIAVLQDRIAAYEDSGCAPEEVLPKDKADEIALKLMRLADLESLCSYDRLRELAEADKDGRVVVLPCKIGDKLYRVFAGEIFEHRVGRMKYFAIQGQWDIETYPFCPCVESSIGKTIFLTREEAMRKGEMT